MPVQLIDYEGTVHDYELRFSESTVGRRLERPRTAASDQTSSFNGAFAACRSS